MADGLRLRPASPDEFNLFVDSWVRSFAKVARMANSKEMAKWAWYRTHRAGVIDLLGSSVVVVAELPDVPDLVLGWVAWEPAGETPLALHYCYVKPDYRRQGIGGMLLATACNRADGRGIRATHHTREGDFLMDAYLANDGAAAQIGSPGEPP